MVTRPLPTSRRSLPRMLSAPAHSPATDRFELIEELGAGASGTVWRAWDRERATEVAIKILHRLDSSILRRFKHEFRTLTNLRHRNVVRFHELFDADDRLFFSMELIDGVDLLCWIWGFDQNASAETDPNVSFDEDTKPNALAVTGPKVDYHRLRSVFAQLTEGLTYVHAAGYLHRDLKPSNLIADHDGRLRILDFGLSAPLVSPQAHELAAAVGTVAYMAPEVAELHAADARADYYGVGVLLFEALTGRTPFPGDDLRKVLVAKATQEPPPPSALAADIPEDLDRLCRHLLTRDPDRRAGADELHQVFRVPRRPAARHTEPRVLARGSGAIAPPPVIGRSREVEHLASALGRTRASGFQCRLVVGPSGIGKSALADSFVRRVAPTTLVLTGRCHDRETIPFRAVDETIDSLAHHLSSLDGAEVAALSARVTTPTGPLIDMFPVLRALGSGGPPPHAALDPGTRRRQAFQCLRELLVALAERSTLALVIDDLHLADPDSLDLLAQVFRSPNAPPVLLVGLGRPGSVIDALCAHAMREGGGSHRIELSALEGDDAERAARAIANYLDVTLADARAVAIDTGGHPGFMAEILRRAEAPLEDTAGDSLPTLEAALGGSIAALTPLARRVLELSTVVAGVCSMDLAAEVLGAAHGELATALDGLVDGNLMVATGRGPDDVFEVYHERIREVADAALDVDSVAALHRELARAMERRGDAEPARLVRHFQAGGDLVRAAYWRTQVAAAALAAYELQRAARLHEESLQARLPLELERQVRRELAMVYGFLGRLADSAAQYLASAQLGSAEDALALSHRAAEALLCAANVDAGGQLLEEVLASLGSQAPQSRFGQVVAVLGGALGGALARRSFRPRDPDPRELLKVDVLSTASTRVGVLEPLRGAVYQQRHLRAARRAGDPIRYARALCAEAVWRAARGVEGARVDRILAEASAVSAHDTSHPHRARLALAEAMTGFLRGELRRSGQAAEQALDALEQCGAGPWWELRQAQTYAVWVHWLTGDYPRLAREVPRWAHDARERSDELTHAMMTAGTANEVWLMADDVGAAEAHLEVAEKTWALHRVAPMRWHLACARAAFELYRGNPAKALAALDAAEGPARRAGLFRVQVLQVTARHLRLRATLARAGQEGTADRAPIAQVATQIAGLRKLDVPWAKPLSELATATYLELLGRRAEAIVQYRRASSALDEAELCGYACAARWRAGALAGDLDGHRERMAVEQRYARTIAAPARFWGHLLGCP